MTTETFETVWRLWMNGPSGFGTLDQQEQLLRRCTKAATTLSELIQVFNAASETIGIAGVRSPALKKMIGLIQNENEARRVYALASRRSQQGFVFKTLEPEAKKKLASFTIA